MWSNALIHVDFNQLFRNSENQGFFRKSPALKELTYWPSEYEEDHSFSMSIQDKGASPD
jgi:hypothetical protein